MLTDLPLITWGCRGPRPRHSGSTPSLFMGTALGKAQAEGSDKSSGLGVNKEVAVG